MGKKIPLIISTLIAGAMSIGGSLALAGTTWAIGIEETVVDPSLLPTGVEINGQKYWSVPEMQRASELIDAKRNEVCDGDLMCVEDLSWQQMDELGGIYRALEPFDNIRFMLTSVNPVQGKVKFLYHDEDKMDSWMVGEKLHYDIASVYAVWVNESLGNVAGTSSNWLSYGQRAPYHLGSVEEVEAATHLVFDESEAEMGSGWFTPNIEREYIVEGENFVDNTSGQFYYSLESTGGGGHIHGVLEYVSCLESSDYKEGMNCDMMYREDGWYTYLPFDPAVARTGDLSDDGLNGAGISVDITGKGQGGALELSAGATETSDTQSNEIVSPDETMTGRMLQTEAAANDAAIKAPNTGENTNRGFAETELPWWCFGIIGFGVITLIWLFWPRRVKK